MTPQKSPEDIKRELRGPVNPIPTPFLADGQLDWVGFRNIIEVGITGGSPVSLLTYGDGQFDFLSDDEVAQLTRCLVEQTAGRALTVAATRFWPDSKAVDFAHFCKEIGVDVLMVRPIARALPPGQIRQYRAVAQVLPVMLVGFPSHAILDALVDEPNICCFKEDGSLDYTVDTIQKYGQYWKFMTGGGLWRNYAQWPWRQESFFCFFSSFAPHLAERYWQAVQDLDVAAAGEIIRDIEYPFKYLASRVSGGFQSLWRVTLELNGVAARYLRLPLDSASDEEVEKIKEPLDRLGLLVKP